MSDMPSASFAKSQMSSSSSKKVSMSWSRSDSDGQVTSGLIWMVLFLLLFLSKWESSVRTKSAGISSDFSLASDITSSN